jgi:hypothetical protein
VIAISLHPNIFYKEVYQMESNNYEGFITNTVETMLPRFSDRQLVLTMKIEAEWTDFGYDRDGNTKIRETTDFRKTFFLVFHRPTNYTKVLMLELPQPPYDKKHGIIQHMPCSGEIQMQQLSDHDSCWRGDGMTWVFQAFVDAWDFFEKIGVEGRDIDPSFHWSIFSGSPQYWLIKHLHCIDPSDRWRSDFIIEFDRRIKLDEIGGYVEDAQM